MCDDPVKYLSADSLSKDTSICEPSKLMHGQVANLWNHWAKRQKAHVQGVEFISARPHDWRESMKAKGKKKAAAFINPGEHDQPQAGDTTLAASGLRTVIFPPFPTMLRLPDSFRDRAPTRSDQSPTL